jgi:N-acetylmuramoyl-L-alanine amidase
MAPPAPSPPVRALVLLILILCSAAAASAAPWNVVLHGGRRYVPIEDVSRFYKLNPPVRNNQAFILSSPSKSIRGRAGTREVFINNVKYILCFPIVQKGKDILISAMDVTKIIEPVMRPGQIRNAGAVRTVVLDAGHGGHDSGAKGPRGIEKEAALDVVLRAKRLLEQAGYTVRLTRSRDVFIPLENRAAFANRFPNAIFISVHFNKSVKGGASGIETFALAPRGVPSMDEENFSYSDLKLHPGHARDPENIALATALHSSMLRHMRLHDRGIKRARFVVIRDVRIPGVLLEGGFMNHPVDGRLIASPAYRDSFARAILDGVNRYQRAVSGTMSFEKPSAVASGADRTSVPDIRSRLSTMGMAPTLNESVQRTAQELKKQATQNAAGTNAN